MSASTAARRRPVSPEQRARRIRYRRRMRAVDLLGIGFWASVALSVGLFLINGGLNKATDTASVLTAAGVVTGLVGTNLILVMIVLAARIPLLDRTIGQDAAIAFHRALGKPVLYLLLAHAILLTLGYAFSDGIDLVAETVSLFNTPDMAISYLGLGLLLVVVVSSLVAVRRRFPYEAWHIIHLLTYLAVLIALPHELSVGGVLADGTVQRTYWIGLYVIAFGGIGWFRFVVPVIRTFRHRITVSSVQLIAPGVVSINLTGRNLDQLRAAGGQYAIWRFWTPSTWWHAHPISFSAVPTRTSARITVRNLGAGSARLSQVKAGSAVSIEGPYGRFTASARTSTYLAVIAAGIGITPIRSLLEDSRLKPGEATVLLRATDDSQSHLWAEIAAIAQRVGVQVFSMLGKRPPRIDTWLSADAYDNQVSLATVFPELAESDLYICGPTGWAALVEHDARAAGLPERQIHVERFDW